MQNNRLTHQRHVPKLRANLLMGEVSHIAKQARFGESLTGFLLPIFQRESGDTGSCAAATLHAATMALTDRTGPVDAIVEYRKTGSLQCQQRVADVIRT